MSSDAWNAENPLLPPAEYDRLTSIRLPRDQWFPGYPDRVPWYHLHVHPWSACRFSLTCGADLDVDTLFKHLTRPKGYVYLSSEAFRSKAATPESELITRLVTSAQVLAIYRQKP